MNFLELAARIAISSDDNRNFLLGAVAKRKDGAIVTACNEMTKDPQPMGHAEARVLRKAGYGATMYVARQTRLGKLAMAKPCPRCQAMIRSYGVVKVCYTIDDENVGIWYPQKNKRPDNSIGYK